MFVQQLLTGQGREAVFTAALTGPSSALLVLLCSVTEATIHKPRSEIVTPSGEQAHLPAVQPQMLMRIRRVDAAVLAKYGELTLIARNCLSVQRNRAVARLGR